MTVAMEEVDIEVEMHVEEDNVDVGSEVGTGEEHSSTVLVILKTIGDSTGRSLNSPDSFRGRC